MGNVYKYCLGAILLFISASVYYARVKSSYVVDGWSKGLLCGVIIIVLLGFPHFLFQWFLSWVVQKFFTVKQRLLLVIINAPILLVLTFVVLTVLLRPPTEISLGKKISHVFYQPIPDTQEVKACFFTQGLLTGYYAGIYFTINSNEMHSIINDQKMNWKELDKNYVEKLGLENMSRFRGVRVELKRPWQAYDSTILIEKGIVRFLYVGNDLTEGMMVISLQEGTLPQVF